MKRGVRIADGDFLWMRYRFDWSNFLEDAVAFGFLSAVVYLKWDETLSLLSRLWWSL